MTRFHLSKDGRGGKAVAVSWEVTGGYPYLSRRASIRGAGCRVGAAGDGSFQKRSRRLPGSSGKAERVKAGPGQALVSSSSRRVWKARLPILRATVSLATVVSWRSRVAR